MDPTVSRFFGLLIGDGATRTSRSNQRHDLCVFAAVRLESQNLVGGGAATMPAASANDSYRMSFQVRITATSL